VEASDRHLSANGRLKVTILVLVRIVIASNLRRTGIITRFALCVRRRPGEYRARVRCHDAPPLSCNQNNVTMLHGPQ
jgi:hypothetical protein